MKILNRSASLITQACSCISRSRSIPSLTRTAATFIPSDAANQFPQESLPKPETKSYFSGSPEYNDAVTQLTTTLSRTRKMLFDRGLLPSYDASPARAWQELTGDEATAASATQSQQLRWLSQEAMTAQLSQGKTIARLSLSQYRRLTSLLSSIRSLERHVQLANDIGLPYSNLSLQEEIADLLQSYRKPFITSLLSPSAHSRSAKQPIDQLGRAYAVGRRKESSAQVWLIPVPPTTNSEAIGQILINNQTLSEYFASTTTREQVTRPFVVTETLGKYNAFVLVKGGGTTGQAGAARLGLAKALLAFEKSVEAKKALRSGRFRQYCFRVISDAVVLVTCRRSVI